MRTACCSHCGRRYGYDELTVHQRIHHPGQAAFRWATRDGFNPHETIFHVIIGGTQTFRTNWLGSTTGPEAIDNARTQGLSPVA